MCLEGDGSGLDMEKPSVLGNYHLWPINPKQKSCSIFLVSYTEAELYFNSFAGVTFMKSPKSWYRITFSLAAIPREITFSIPSSLSKKISRHCFAFTHHIECNKLPQITRF